MPLLSSVVSSSRLDAGALEKSQQPPLHLPLRRRFPTPARSPGNNDSTPRQLHHSNSGSCHSAIEASNKQTTSRIVSTAACANAPQQMRAATHEGSTHRKAHNGTWGTFPRVTGGENSVPHGGADACPFPAAELVWQTSWDRTDLRPTSREKRAMNNTTK